MRHGKASFLLLRYEDILQNPERELIKVAEFMGLEVTPERLSRAVELSSADHMRKLEKRQSLSWALTKNTRQDKPFVRTASAGGWRASLPPKSVAAIEAAWGPLMERLGYRLSENSRERVAPATEITTSDS